MQIAVQVTLAQHEEEGVSTKLKVLSFVQLYAARSGTRTSVY